MRSFKSKVRREWKTWKRQHTDGEGHCPQIQLLDIVHIISNAWEDVQEFVIENGFGVILGEEEQELDEMDEPDPVDGLEFIDDFDELELVVDGGED